MITAIEPASSSTSVEISEAVARELKLADAANWSQLVAGRLKNLAEYGKESLELFDTDLSTMVLLMARQAQWMVESLQITVSELVSMLEDSLEDVRKELAST